MYSNVPFQGETYDTGFQEVGKGSQRKQKRGDILSQLPSSAMDKHESTFNFLCESRLVWSSISQNPLCLIWYSSTHSTDLPSHPLHHGIYLKQDCYSWSPPIFNLSSNVAIAISNVLFDSIDTLLKFYQHL